MRLQENFSLKKYNTFGIDVTAKYFANFKTADELQEASEFDIPSTGKPHTSTLILGGGSNILFTRSFDGLVLKNEIPGIEIINEDEKYAYVKAGAGENWHKLVMYCIEKNLGGMENLSLIPGSVGASPMQNIGAYGAEIKDVFQSLEAYHLQDKTMVNFDTSACEFGYRESVFKGKYKNQFVITSVTYRLSKKPQLNISYGAISQELESMGVHESSIKDVSQAVINIRSSKLPDPAQLGNAGSFFKNPEINNAQFHLLKEAYPGIVGYNLHNGNTKLAAGWMIEQCGWKGYRQGDAGCHSKQALVLVNYGNASGEQIYALSERIIESVLNKFGVMLSREVNMV
jgi:UDP-N-acetylmuramate dehydrogenase